MNVHLVHVACVAIITCAIIWLLDRGLWVGAAMFGIAQFIAVIRTDGSKS